MVFMLPVMETFPLVVKAERGWEVPRLSLNDVVPVPVVVVNEKFCAVLLSTVEAKEILLLVVVKAVLESRLTAPVYVWAPEVTMLPAKLDVPEIVRVELPVVLVMELPLPMVKEPAVREVCKSRIELPDKVSELEDAPNVPEPLNVRVPAEIVVPPE